MKPFAIAGVQMNVSAAHSNVPMMKHKIDVLMSVYPWVEMVVFSELGPFGPLTHNAVVFPNAVEKEFQNIAKKYGIWLLPGSMFQKRNNKIYNTASVINPQGEIVGRYDKMFPFMPYEEGVTGGSDFLIFDVPDVGKFGVSICYDMWFPETIRTMVVQGVEVILHPSLTGTIDRDIEIANAQATAALHQCFVVDINGIKDGGTGRSILCGPDGRVLYEANVGEEFIPLELDLKRVKRSRKYGTLRLGQTLKSFRDRKVDFDIYEKGKKFPFLESLGPLSKPERHNRTPDLEVLQEEPEDTPDYED